MFCNNCGKNIGERTLCPYCENEKNNNYSYIKPSKQWNTVTPPSLGNTSRFIAGILQIFLGCLGLGRFYMKSYKIGFLQIIISIFTFGIGGLFYGFIDGFMILSGKIKYDGQGKSMIE